MFERFVGLVTLWLRLYTSNTRLTELIYISVETKLEISAVNNFQCFVLTKMSGEDVIMIVLENTCAEVTSRWYINPVIKEE